MSSSLPSCAGAELRRYLSGDHFSVDGTLLDAWASHKSFKPNDGPPSGPPAGGNVDVPVARETVERVTRSTTDPEAFLPQVERRAGQAVRYTGTS